MVVFGFVGVEVYFSEESVFHLLVGFMRFIRGGRRKRTFSRDALVGAAF